MKNGYVMIDCKGMDLKKGSTPQTVAGLHDRLVEVMKYGKPIFAYNMIWDDDGAKPVTPVQTFAIDFGDYIICTASTLQIIVTKDATNNVTINNLAPAATRSTAAKSTK